MVIKSQSLADFIAKFTYSDTIEVAGIADNAEAAKQVETITSKYEDSDQDVE